MEQPSHKGDLIYHKEDDLMKCFQQRHLDFSLVEARDGINQQGKEPDHILCAKLEDCITPEIGGSLPQCL